MRTFKLVRNEDFSGVSGTGEVAEGVQFNNGKCVMCWDTATSSIAVYESVQDVVNIHGHEGRTIVAFEDGEVVTDIKTSQEFPEFEEMNPFGVSLTTEGWSTALKMRELLAEGITFSQMPNKLGMPEVPSAALETLYVLAKAMGTI